MRTPEQHEALELAAHASSVWSGMTYGNQEERAINAWDQGCYELHFYCAEVAEHLQRIENLLYKALGDDGFPGMFTYEVSETLGGELIDLGFPRDELVLKTRISQLVIDFCRAGGEKAVAIAERVTQEWKDE